VQCIPSRAISILSLFMVPSVLVHWYNLPIVAVLSCVASGMCAAHEDDAATLPQPRSRSHAPAATLPQPRSRNVDDAATLPQCG
jgi:hypothetical protein